MQFLFSFIWFNLFIYFFSHRQKNNLIFKISGFFSLKKERERKGQCDCFYIRIIQLYFQFHRGLYSASLLQYILHIESFIFNLGWIDLQYKVYNLTAAHPLFKLSTFSKEIQQYYVTLKLLYCDMWFNCLVLSVCLAVCLNRELRKNLLFSYEIL